MLYSGMDGEKPSFPLGRKYPKWERQWDNGYFVESLYGRA